MQLSTSKLLKASMICIMLSMGACSTNDSDDLKTMTAKNSTHTASDERLSLTAEVVQWDTRIDIHYSLLNNSSEPLVAFDGEIGLSK